MAVSAGFTKNCLTQSLDQRRACEQADAGGVNRLLTRGHAPSSPGLLYYPPNSFFFYPSKIWEALVKTRQIQLWCLVVFLLAVAVIWLRPAQSSSASSEAKSPFKKLLEARARLTTRESKTYRLPAMSAD